MHPSYIIGKRRGTYLYLGLTHKKKKGKKHPNHELSKNPKQGDGSKAYIRKRIEEDTKTAFTKERYTNYRMSSKDDEYVDVLISWRILANCSRRR